MAIGGGTASGAEAAVGRAVAEGAEALLSFGFCGGIDPALRAGDLVIPRFVRVGAESFEADAALVLALGGATQQVLLGAGEIVASAAAKRALWQRTGAAAVDVESGAVARAGLRFAALRAVCDPAQRDLPPAALIPLSDGKIAFGAILAELARHPGQLPGLIALARDAAKAKSALRGFAPGFLANG